MSIRRWVGSYSRMPVRIKLTLGSAALLMVLFAGYNTLQYILMDKWIVHREKNIVEHNMSSILNFFLERESAFTLEELPEIRHYLDKLNRDSQIIRIMNAEGAPIITVTNNLSGEWALPPSSSQQELLISSSGEHSVLVMTSPLTIFDSMYTVEVIRSMAEYEEWTKAISRIMIYFTIGAVALSVLVGWLLSWRLLKPLQALAQTIRKVKDKDFHERTQPSSNGDELSTLMLLFNEMMDQVEDSFRQQSRFVEDASHELRTPIAIIEGHLALLERWGKEDPVILNESLYASLQEFARLKSLVLQLLALSRAEESSISVACPLTNIRDEIDAIISRVAPIYPDFQFNTHVEPLEDVTVAISSEHLEQIILIIVDNAVKFSHDNKTVVIAGTRYEGNVIVEITDYGIGIPAKDIPYVADRFYRVDQARGREQGGNGIGLAIAKRLSERYMGTIAIRSQESVGTTVSITLPIASVQDYNRGGQLQ